jgi:hypothetical protein
MRARRDAKKRPTTAADSSAGRSGSRPEVFSSPALSSVELLDQALQIEHSAPCRASQDSEGFIKDEKKLFPSFRAEMLIKLLQTRFGSSQEDDFHQRWVDRGSGVEQLDESRRASSIEHRCSQPTGGEPSLSLSPLATGKNEYKSLSRWRTNCMRVFAPLRSVPCIFGSKLKSVSNCFLFSWELPPATQLPEPFCKWSCGKLLYYKAE